MSIAKRTLPYNKPLDISMNQAARMVDCVQEMKGICNLVRNAESHIPCQTNIPSPVETVA